MKKSAALTAVGGGLLLFGIFWGGTSYKTYPNDLGREISENAIWVGSCVLAVIVTLVATRIRDGEQ